MNDSEDKEPGKYFLKSISGAIILVIAWLFALGWTYLHNYYRYFGINVNSLDFPIFHYLVFSFTQFVSFRWPGLFLAGMMLLILALIWVGMKTERVLAAFCISIVYLVIFGTGFFVATLDARKAAFGDMGPDSALPQFVFELKEKPSFEEHTIQNALESADLRLLLETHDHVFVFQPLTKEPENMSSATVDVLELNVSDLKPSVRTVRVK
jgi:hypothetical protein